MLAAHRAGSTRVILPQKDARKAAASLWALRPPTTNYVMSGPRHHEARPTDITFMPIARAMLT
ncbi:hypothetical protein WME93_36055 [Sorangium sp. So ce1000]